MRQMKPRLHRSYEWDQSGETRRRTWSDGWHEIVKTDAELCNVFLCAIDFEHDQRSSFCETNPTSQQIKVAEEFRTGIRRSNLAGNAEKSGRRMVHKLRVAVVEAGCKPASPRWSQLGTSPLATTPATQPCLTQNYNRNSTDRSTDRFKSNFSPPHSHAACPLRKRLRRDANFCDHRHTVTIGDGR